MKKRKKFLNIALGLMIFHTVSANSYTLTDVSNATPWLKQIKNIEKTGVMNLDPVVSAIPTDIPSPFNWRRNYNSPFLYIICGAEGAHTDETTKTNCINHLQKLYKVQSKEIPYRERLVNHNTDLGGAFFEHDLFSDFLVYANLTKDKEVTEKLKAYSMWLIWDQERDTKGFRQSNSDPTFYSRAWFRRVDNLIKLSMFTGNPASVRKKLDTLATRELLWLVNRKANGSLDKIGITPTGAVYLNQSASKGLKTPVAHTYFLELFNEILVNAKNSLYYTKHRKVMDRLIKAVILTNEEVFKKSGGKFKVVKEDIALFNYKKFGGGVNYPMKPLWLSLKPEDIPVVVDKLKRFYLPFFTYKAAYLNLSNKPISYKKGLVKPKGVKKGNKTIKQRIQSLIEELIKIRKEL